MCRLQNVKLSFTTLQGRQQVECAPTRGREIDSKLAVKTVCGVAGECNFFGMALKI
jgi:hypothetical protein